MKKIIYTLLICILTISMYAQNHEHIVNYNFNGTPVNGVKIKTNLCLGFMKLLGSVISLPGDNAWIVRFDYECL